MHQIRNYYILLMLMLACPPLTASPDTQSFSFGVFPHISSAQIEKIFAPFTAHLSKQVGKTFHFRTRPSFQAFSMELEKESYDIAFVQPFDYIKAHDRFHYLPVARRSAKLFGVFVVRPESPLQHIKDLKGKKIGLPPKTAAVSHLVKLALIKQGFNIEKDKDVVFHYQKTHDACLNQLWLGKVDSCASAIPPIRFFQKTWKVKFRELGRTKAIPTAVFVVHQRVPPGYRKAIQEAILSWEHTETGRNMLKKNKFTSFRPADDTDYKPVRDISKRLSLE